MSLIVVGLLWSWIYNPSFGLLASGLRYLGLEQWVQPWLGQENTVLGAIIIADIWKWTGFHMVLYLSGLTGIPLELYEAAKMDGAKAWGRFFYITLPLLAPIIFINVFLSLNGAFVTNYDLVYIMSGGGPNHASEVVLTRMVANAFSYSRLGYASAMGYVLFAVVAFISYFYIKFARSGTTNY